MARRKRGDMSPETLNRARQRDRELRAIRRLDPDVRAAEQEREEFRRLDPEVLAADREQQQIRRLNPEVREAEREQHEIRRLDPVIRAAERVPNREQHTNRRAIRNAVNGGIGANCVIDTFVAEDIEPFTLDGYGTQCTFCSALGFTSENKGTIAAPHFGKLCCNKGKVEIPALPQLPVYLDEIINSQASDARYFRKSIRMFNSQMAMASVLIDKFSQITHGVPGAFRIQGQMHRFIGPLIPGAGTEPRCLQVYFYDPQTQAEMRALRLRNTPNSAAHERDIRIFRSLHQVLIDCNNSYLESFLQVKEFVDSLPEEPRNIRILIDDKARPSGVHPGRLNVPSVPEVSILMPNDIPANSTRMLICKFRADDNATGLCRFSDCHRSYDPLQYPLMFPLGTDGWHYRVKNISNDKNVSLIQYVRYHIVSRSLRNHVLHRMGKLFQQWIVDNYCKAEAMRIRWIKNHQKELRADLYNGVMDSMERGDGDRSGRAVIMPASFTGGDRFMHQAYQNSMAIVHYFGKPDLFLTMTMDIKCVEITSQLEPGQTPYDRPDLISRVFQEKKKHLIRDIEGGCFFKVLARCHSIEFQKRGAPHMHMLIYFLNYNPTPRDIDKLICAEIPPVNHPLRAHVLKMHIHGPCGQCNPRLACMKGGVCSKKFPKDFSFETTIGEDAYPNYRRRSPEHGGETATVYCKGIQVLIDNRLVVPYSPYLLRKYACHINVEYCASIKSVKYVFKYCMKGNDMAAIELEGDGIVDETKIFQDKRYVSSCEATWRIFEYEITEMKPSVLRLQLHLENGQSIVYNPNEPGAQEIALEQFRKTMLTEYFEANVLLEGAAEVHYRHFPVHFVWVAKDKRWKLRERVNVQIPTQIGRMISIHPNQGEKFFLRMMLVSRCGATSFEDLRTVDNVIHTTYKSACIAAGLLEDDSQWLECLQEASLTKMPGGIRDLFVVIIYACQPADPGNLFHQFKDFMMEDYVHRRTTNGMNPTDVSLLATNELLRYLDRAFMDVGKSNEEFGIPVPDDAYIEEEIIFNPELDEGAAEYFETNFPLLNAGQRNAFEVIRQRIDENEGGFFSLDAPGGTGKTLLNNVILSYVRKDNHVAIATAASGIAGTLLKMGTTSHSRFAFPIPIFEDSVCSIRLNSERAAVIKAAKVMILDEITMLHRCNLGALDRFLKILMMNDDIFGGKLIIVSGDFRQILPVVPKGRRPHIVAATVKSSELWNQCTTLRLTENMRVERLISMNPTVDNRLRLQTYADWLLQIGEGTAPTVNENIIEIPNYMYTSTVESLKSRVFDDFQNQYSNIDYVQSRAILTPLNVNVDSLNSEFVNDLPGEPIVSKSIDCVVDEDDITRYPIEFLNDINLSGLPPHILTIKKFCVIMLMRNLNQKRGHCNGTRYMVTQVTSRIIYATKLGCNANDPNATIMIPKIPIHTKQDDFPFILKRIQWPVRIAYVMSMNKAQGQTFTKCGLLLPNSVFTHGQLYVGLSRCGEPKNLFIYVNQDEYSHLPNDKFYTRNVVYPEVLG